MYEFNILDIDGYLPDGTLAWCTAQLATYNINLASLSASDIDPISGEAGVRLHTRAYSILQSVVRRHILAKAHPELQEYPKPEGGYTEIEARGGALAEVLDSNSEFVQRGVDIEAQLEGERVQELYEDDELDDAQMDG